MTKVTAIYPGTFDPITKGHLDIIKRASKLFDRLIVAIADDTPKFPIFSLEERLQMTKDELAANIFNANIEVMKFSGLLVDFAKQQGSFVIVRGLRAASDFEYEFQMSYMNHKIAPDIQTIFVPANENGHFISSRFVKELARLGSKVEGFVSPTIAGKLYAHFKNN
ncbi:MAG: pantetheine-phosphate adenylyltransferase [Alphaproteobacteria bacterium]|jgi:pantetheine-phosphate adenylyltransferase|nr:pantetheine-phosphate adenylyltransferase [Candidatus Jidaibacter sp.]